MKNSFEHLYSLEKKYKINDGNEEDKLILELFRYSQISAENNFGLNRTQISLLVQGKVNKIKHRIKRKNVLSVENKTCPCQF